MNITDIDECLEYCQAVSLTLWKTLRYRVNFLTSADFVSISKLAYFKFRGKFNEAKSSVKTFLYMKVRFQIYDEILADSRFKISMPDRKVYFKLQRIQSFMVEKNQSWVESVSEVLGITIENASEFTDLNIGFISFDELLEEEN